MRNKDAIKDVLILLVIFSFFLFLFSKNVKPAFLLFQTFPNSPIKPLNIFPDPIHKRFTIGKNNTTEIDLFLPRKKGLYPAIMMASGIKLQDKDNEGMMEASQNLSKLGYIVVWPRSKQLSNGKSFSDTPQTFIDTFQYLNNRDDVLKNRISIIGFSAGASLAMVAAEKPEMAGRLHAFVFFAGYFDILDYLKSISNKSYSLNEKEYSWKQEKYLENTTKSILKNQNLENLLNQVGDNELADLSTRDLSKLKQISPDYNISNFKTPIFIIHDLSDSTVPFVESIKLAQKLDKSLIKSFVLTNSFNHVRPVKLSLLESIKVYGFYYEIVNYF